MAAGLGYQSGAELGSPVRGKRRVVWRRLLVAFGVLVAGLVVLLIAAVWWASQPTMNRVTLTITNATSTPVTDAGFDGIYDERVVSAGSILPGQTCRLSAKYNENDCPTRFTFDQSGQTWRVPLDGNLIDDDSTYVVTITGRDVNALCVAKNGATTRYVQVPTTRPIR